MAIDPSDPDTLEELLATDRERSVETPEADAAEQRTELRPRDEAAPAAADPDAADPADAADQARTVEREEDEYR
ncbi:hypothetical protein [Streptomyces bohaiensis]|uniref:Uncharacterized protein n=1 Tax=Streptomyces bohaiensis TaxID=1431344 RepID=A0ABX1CF52_9ACTN|nr:hypothetical protein [Streptomyces bohaiensis]NJQ15849.1 hypothetical protein [Streptomyces bohaiensis]